MADRKNGKVIVTIALAALVIVLFLVASADAAPTGGNVTEGITEHGNGTTSGTVSVQGGNVTGINISGTMITTKWAGFYGFISGGIELTDASANKFYVWTVTNFTGAVVYASNASISSWSNLKAMNFSSAPAGVKTSGSDDYNHTYTQTTAFSSPSIASISNTPYVTTYQNGAAGTLRTYALTSADELTNIWAGVAQTNVSSFKTGQRVDYQILAPAKNSGTTYNFYLELP